ncbi:MAG: hypothetical protein HY901_28755, partial [Deltaproteobacteria bacterium]|nr:hypothetical protein [Deltaproteobacteria bacterium]
SLAFSPTAATAADALGSGTGDEERREHEEAASAQPVASPTPTSAPAEAVAKTPPSETASRQSQYKPLANDFIPATQSITLDLGGAANFLGGWGYPKIRVRGIDPDTGFYAHGLGGAFKLHWDFTAQDLDWRLGVDGTLPGYAAIEGTVGVRKDMGPWRNPRLLMRAAGGVELMLGAGDKDSSFLIPVFVGKGEAAVEFSVVENLWSIGVGFELGVRYGLPLGIGFDFGTFLRNEIWF